MKYESIKIGIHVKYICGMRSILMNKEGIVIKQDSIHIIKNKPYSMFWVEFEDGNLYDCMPESLELMEVCVSGLNDRS